MDATFATHQQAFEWAKSYGLSYPFTIKRVANGWRVDFITSEPYGC